jgi:5'-phosphate synthase pdxT subunit
MRQADRTPNKTVNKTIGVLALQGAVAEHIAAAQKLGFAGLPVKTPAELARADALVLPGGESTAISRLICKNGLFEPIQAFARQKPVFGTCAGLILCGTTILGQDEARFKVEPLGLMESTVSRNGFGRQVDSFETGLDIEGIGRDVPGVFIRAPYIEEVGPGVKVLARLEHPGLAGPKIVMAECGNILVASFHPELTSDLRVMEYFCSKLN